MSLSKQSEPPKPWSVSEFQLYRKNITDFVDNKMVPLLENIQDKIRRICIHGEVKSGKREIVEYIAKRDEGSSQRVHIFISAFHRIADESQRKELSEHNIKVFSIKNNDDALEAIKYISNKIREGIHIIIHLDECDYGTGSRQNLKKIYGKFKMSEEIMTILYSATPEELLFSQDITQDEDDDNFAQEIYELGLRVYYIPPETYCGAKKFIDEGLVFDAKPFFEKNDSGEYRLSSQGKSIILDAKKNIEEEEYKKIEAKYKFSQAKREGNLNESSKYETRANKKNRNLIILRLTYKTFGPQQSRNGLRSIEAFVKNINSFPELENVNVIVDKTDYKVNNIPNSVMIEQVQWSKREYWDNKIDDKLIIIVHEQTSTRSTEWAFHDRTFATHDYRPNISYGTVAQANLRAAHYKTKYGKFQRIRIYGHLKTFLLAAKQISVTDYLNDEWKKIQVKKDLFKIDEKVKYKYNDGIWIDAIIKNYDINSKKYQLMYRREDREYLVRDVSKSEIKLTKEQKKYNIKNISDDTIHYVYNEEYDEKTADKILEELGCNIKTELSSRVKGKSKHVLKIIAKFIKCDENNIHEKITEEIKNNNMLPEDVRCHKFILNNLFDYHFINENEEKIYKGTLRGIRDVYTYDNLEKSRWGFDKNNTKPRLTVCYKGSDLGVCLRYTTGEKEEVTTLSSYLSMYQPMK